MRNITGKSEETGAITPRRDNFYVAHIPGLCYFALRHDEAYLRWKPEVVEIKDRYQLLNALDYDGIMAIATPKLRLSG